jgi:CRISPR-associated protein Csm5
MKTENRFYIRILSPVHIGCDEVYEPMGFVVDENSCTLTAFDPLEFFRSLNPQEREQYTAISRKGTIVSLLELYRFMRVKRFCGHDVEMSEGLMNHYRQTLSMKPSEGNSRKVQQELNNFTIARTAFNEHDSLPYIPGSAIKGALRTAYLNHLAAGKTVRDDPRDRNPSQTMEKRFLEYDKLEHDPFRLLKVSDFMPVKASTKIVYAVNEKKKPSKFKARGPYQILEIIKPGAIFTGTITVEGRYAKEAGIRQPLTEEALFKSVDVFYDREMKREKEELQAAGLPILKEVDSVGGLLFRIGRHSGAESLTVEGLRKIKIMQGKDKQAIFSKTGATTFWLVAEARTDYSREQLQPFGWASLVKMTEANKAVFEKMREEEKKTRTHTVSKHTTAPLPEEIDTLKEKSPQEETWGDSYVSFNACGGGVVTATSRYGKKAEIRGKEKALAAVDESLHKMLFDKPRSIPKASVTVRILGKYYEIIRVEAMKS